MKGVLISVLVAAGLVSPPFHGSAVADEAYVCEGGRIAYVRFGELEVMKRKDPCIAAYYGEPSERAPDMADVVAAGDHRIDKTDDDALPVVRTAGSRLPATARSSAAPVLKDLPRLATPPSSAAAPKLAAAKPATRASAPPPVAHPETDFRNVRILNAGPGEAAIFRHAR